MRDTYVVLGPDKKGEEGVFVFGSRVAAEEYIENRLEQYRVEDTSENCNVLYELEDVIERNESNRESFKILKRSVLS